MKKYYIAPEVQVVTVELGHLLEGSMGVSNTTTSSQWSRRNDGGWDEGDE